MTIATRWRKLSGEGDWMGLLHPNLDPDLRRYIIHYGEKVGAVGDLYNDDTKGPNAAKEDFFTQACLIKGNEFEYKLTHFIYASSDDVESSWFGYVAVSTDKGKRVLGRRDILIAWRGTKTNQEWVNNVNGMILKPASELFGSHTNAKVHTGFLDLYTGKDNNNKSARMQVLDAVKEMVNNNKYKNEEISITVTGYSLGAALATLTAMDIVANEYNKPKSNPNKSFMVTGFVYGGPRVGDQGLKDKFSNLGHDLHLLRITNKGDTVPQVPAGPFYTHLGEELMIDTSKSNYLKFKDSVSAHVLDVYLHGVAGVQKDGFSLVAKHDTALINKYLNCLKEDNRKIPPYWWKGENRKRMVQMDDGHWEVVDGK